MTCVRAPLALLFALTTSTAATQELPAEGRFVANFTSTGFDPVEPVPIGPERDFGIYQSLLTATNAAGEGLLHNLTGRCVGWYVVDRGAGTYEQRSRCYYTDADGDELWEQVDFEPQPLGPVRIALGRWIGGTGKYVDLRGEFEVRVRPLRPAAPDIAQAIGSKEGSYRIAR